MSDPPRVQLGKKLGKGSFATVYAAQYDGVGEVAIKVLHPHLKPSAELLSAAQRQQQEQKQTQPVLSNKGGSQDVGTSLMPDQGDEAAFKCFLREALLMTKLTHRCAQVQRCLTT